MRKICKNADFVIKPAWGQSPSAYLQLTLKLSKSLFSKVSKSTLSSICDILQARPLSSRLCGRRCCKKGLLNLHSQRPFLTQSLASCHITLPSCPPAFALSKAAMRFSQRKLCSTAAHLLQITAQSAPADCQRDAYPAASVNGLTE